MTDLTTIDRPLSAEHDNATEETNVVELRPRVVKSSSEAASVPDVELAPALEHQLEALLFVSPTPLTTEQLANLTDQDVDDLHDCLVDMMQSWADDVRGIVLERVAGGWAFRAAERCGPVLRKMTRPQGDTKLSPSAIETLSIVAYLQPVSRPDLAKIRGVSVDAAMSGLMERGFVEEAGRSESGAVLFRTTAHFERAFGLSSIGGLPELEGFAPSDDDVVRMKEQLEKMAEARVE